MPRKHHPLRLDRYKRIHEEHLAQLEEARFVERNLLKFSQTEHEVFIYGDIVCSGPIVLRVNKKLSILGRDAGIPVVKSKTYEYNVSLAKMHNLFRYDNTHRGKRYAGHPDDFHRHEFDIRTGEPRPGSPRWIGYDDWPTLDKVIVEACHLYLNNKELIDLIALEQKASWSLIT